MRLELQWSASVAGVCTPRSWYSLLRQVLTERHCGEISASCLVAYICVSPIGARGEEEGQGFGLPAQIDSGTDSGIGG
jgi:hypothetical protein